MKNIMLLTEMFSWAELRPRIYNKRGIKCLSYFAGRAKLCALGRRLPGGLSLWEIMPEYMVWIGADRFKQPQRGLQTTGSPQAGSHIFGAPSEGTLAGSAAPRWQTPTTPGRHIAGRQQLSPLPQDATLEDEGHAPLAYAEQISMTHMKKLLDQCGRPQTIVGSEALQALSVVQRARHLV